MRATTAVNSSTRCAMRSFLRKCLGCCNVWSLRFDPVSNPDDGEFAPTCMPLHSDRIVHLLAEQRSTHGRLPADLAALGIDLIDTNDAERQQLAGVVIFHVNERTEKDSVRSLLTAIDDHDVLQSTLQKS